MSRFTSSQHKEQISGVNKSFNDSIKVAISDQLAD